MACGLCIKEDNLWTLVTLRALLFSATWNFFVSLAVFPGVVTQLPVNGLSDRQLQWFLLGMFSAFTSGDLIGKFLPSFSQLRLALDVEASHRARCNDVGRRRCFPLSLFAVHLPSLFAEL